MEALDFLGWGFLEGLCLKSHALQYASKIPNDWELMFIFYICTQWISHLKTSIMDTKKVLTREYKPTDELHSSIEKIYNGLNLTYIEAYYLDYEVSEDSGLINKEKKVKHYTKEQVNRNLKALKSAYLIAKGAASPTEIIEFRNKYHIAASTLSILLGFSKNTISNIENDGVTSLPSGRLIKMCLSDKDILYSYIKVCDAIDNRKKDEIVKKLLHHGI